MDTSTGKTDQPSVRAYRFIRRGEHVDWLDQRRNGLVVVVDVDHAWVHFPEMQEPCKYPVDQLRPAALLPFREFVAARRGGTFAAQVGEPYHAYVVRLAEALADYADEIRKRG